MQFGGSSFSDGEYLRMKEEELERTLRHADSLREVISVLRRFVRIEGGAAVPVPTISERKRPSREERVAQLLRGGPLTLEALARAFKIQKSEMRRWMDARLSDGLWQKTNDGYALADALLAYSDGRTVEGR